MRLKGALHVHSSLSHDGTLTIAQLVEWYKFRRYNFFALGEHSQDMDDAKIRQMQEQSAQHSRDSFCVIPGLEYSCRGGFHLFAAGSVEKIPDVDAVAVATKARAAGGFVVLAHPSRVKWRCPAELMQAVDAAEFWNVTYDGKYLPSFRAPAEFRRMRQANPRILVTAGQDFHCRQGFYDVAVYIKAASVSADAILAEIRQGRYEIRSRFFRMDSRGYMSAFKSASFSILSRQLAGARRARDSFQRWTS
jgi:hypothetical protein